MTDDSKKKLGKECIISTGHMVPAKPLTKETMAKARAQAVAEVEADQVKDVVEDPKE